MPNPVPQIPQCKWAHGGGGVGSMQTPCCHANDMEMYANKRRWPSESGSYVCGCLSVCLSVRYRASPDPRKCLSIQLCVVILEFMLLAVRVTRMSPACACECVHPSFLRPCGKHCLPVPAPLARPVRMHVRKCPSVCVVCVLCAGWRLTRVSSLIT